MATRDMLLQVLSVDEPAGLLPAREQMAMTLGWHIILACFGVAFPAMILVMHWRGIRRDDQVALGLAQRWSKVSAVLFAIGAVSGTVLSFEMGLLWPGLMGRFGDVLGLPFAVEGLAFFVEAIFLGIYLYGWGRMPPKRHVLMLIPMAISGVVGTFSVIAVNAWMNNPTGFRMVKREVSDVQPWRAFFNDGVWSQFAHMWVGAFMVVGFLVSGVYAVGMLRGRVDAHHRLGFTIPFLFASAAAIAQPFIGHLLGLRLGGTQPSKLAAFELATTTESPSALRLGGVLIDGQVRGSSTSHYSDQSSPAIPSAPRSRASTRSRSLTSRPSTSLTSPSSRWSASAPCSRSPRWCSGGPDGADVICSRTACSFGSRQRPDLSPSSPWRPVGSRRR